MSPKLQPVRGTHDILPEEFKEFHKIIEGARDIARLYGFEEMATPIFEATEVFARSMGETSDVVSKEMFSFETKGGEGVTLRPEFTAGIVRAFISNGMQQHLPLKLFSTGPLFRYERPQKGRQRQFHQVNFEWLGDDSPQVDIDLICMAGQLLYYLSGNTKGCTLLINTLGDKESRAKYREALVKYLTPYAKELSEDSQRRLASNPLRILDSKSEQDRKIIEGAPQINQYLNDAARKRFNIVHEALSHQDSAPMFQSVKITPTLVRGLDYYTDTVFEFVAETGELGAQNTVLAGGRYDGLIEQMGGKPTPAIGFAAGVERLLLLGGEKWPVIGKKIKLMIIPFEEVNSIDVHRLATQLRITLTVLPSKMGIMLRSTVETLWQGKLGKRLEKASQRGATHALILAPEELKQNLYIVRNMQTREEQKVPIDAFKDMQKIRNIFGF